ncbi:hypothetical protein BS47DRAFT_360093 [Hydnum rufescens UP504]|uniref:Uncharacterized protein n=1 Tax=Hydnum rufescens UP504 TaxID=1448309 RepID=A0A9P6DLJ5_9AGAM|nr:hypothetical protein BS47DRAFT_360093 [Hydnum rufescens UP504]
MDAKARAEARRQAILAKASSRLAKLTSSARGEETEASIHDDPPLPTLPSVRAIRRTPSPIFPRQPSALDHPSGGEEPLPQDAFEAILSSLGSSGMTNDESKLSPTTSTSPFEPTPLPPRSLPFMPFFRFLSTIAMVIFFVFYLEPFNFARMGYYGLETPSRWGRWADLTRRETGEWGVQPVPIFWAFISLQLAVHSFQFFYDNQPSPLPMFVAMVLPHFPHPLPTIVTNAFHYVHMTQMLLDDMAVWVVTVGFIIWVAGWGN